MIMDKDIMISLDVKTGNMEDIREIIEIAKKYKVEDKIIIGCF